MTDWVEITALVTGPVLAVGLTLWRESKRQQRERRLGVMRQLLLARSSPSDPAFSAAVNLVPIEFGTVATVMTAWEDFTDAAIKQQAKAEHIDALVKTILLTLSYSERAASQMARSAYASSGLEAQRQLMEGVLKGVVSVARSSRLSAQASATVAEHIVGKPLPPLPPE